MISLRQKGFTLLELLIAITIFAIGLLTVAGMQMAAIQANMDADSNSVATAIAQGVLEDILSRSADDDIFGDTVADEPFALNAAAMANIRGGDRYEASYDITLNSPAPGMAQVRVRVDGGRTMTVQTRSVSLTGFKRL
ncbi:type IV pilus assembly protein PilV [Geoalkalibacter ferrihydriticus]|uniref:Pilus assembly protein PilV n=2 Tax=Geoalkalibacter ferrihydriticus TaxID=392333 RepID=A0A0C2EE88_9BACT|nr:prepilin-type N-terminal cleavage/methylation domain-containing protein [Geoalkalibacter ferrihydriticus]KIH76928.1 hypothetical protein GFER_07520 [Geoalkalibacter ferrihydriticus DSM 17813]SDL44059.1 type IV pilus assembly protein PilV [Geoalkalibacter ferrihydriticus]